MFSHIIVIVIGQVTGVTLTCELISMFDYYCTVMWNVIQVCIFEHTHITAVVLK